MRVSQTLMWTWITQGSSTLGLEWGLRICISWYQMMLTLLVHGPRVEGLWPWSCLSHILLIYQIGRLIANNRPPCPYPCPIQSIFSKADRTISCPSIVSLLWWKTSTPFLSLRQKENPYNGLQNHMLWPTFCLPDCISLLSPSCSLHSNHSASLVFRTARSPFI